MRRGFLASHRAWALVGLLALRAAAARAQEAAAGEGRPARSESDRAVAAQLFDVGVAAAARGDFAAALGAFRSSHTLVPAGDALLNIANCLIALDDFPGAARVLLEFDRNFRATASAADQADIDLLYSDVLPRIARLEIVASENGATVTIDGEVVGTTPLESWIPLVPGRHAVIVRKTGFVAASSVVDIPAGQLVRTVVSLVPEAGAAPTPTSAAPTGTRTPAVAGAPTPIPRSTAPVAPVPAAPPDSSWGSAPTDGWMWACLGLTVAAAAGAATTGGLAIRYRDEFVEGGAVDADLRETTLALRTTTDVLLGIAVAAAVGFTTLLIVREPETPEGAAIAPARPAVTALLGPAGLIVRW